MNAPPPSASRLSPVLRLPLRLPKMRLFHPSFETPPESAGSLCSLTQDLGEHSHLCGPATSNCIHSRPAHCPSRAAADRRASTISCLEYYRAFSLFPLSPSLPIGERATNLHLVTNCVLRALSALSRSRNSPPGRCLRKKLSLQRSFRDAAPARSALMILCGHGRFGHPDRV